MKRLVLIALLSFNICVLLGQDMGKESKKVVSDFIEFVRLRKVDEIRKSILFPFDRGYPLPQVKHQLEFERRYDEIFDSSLTKEIVNSKLSDWAEVGWRGIMLFNGDLWLDYDGRLRAVRSSPVEEKKRHLMIQEEKDSLYPSIRKFVQPLYLLETSKYRIRIDDLGNWNYRYTSWPLGRRMSDRPAIIIEKGEYIPEGSGGDHSYKFRKEGYVYDCSIIEMGEDGSPPARLTVYKGKKIILTQDAKIISN